MLWVKSFFQELCGIWLVARAVVWGSIGRCPIHGLKMVVPEDEELRRRREEVCPACLAESKEFQALNLC